MIARFLQNIVVNDIEKNMEMNIDKAKNSLPSTEEPIMS